MSTSGSIIAVRNRGGRRGRLVGFAFAASLALSAPVSAGMPVLDPSNLVQNLVAAMESVKSTLADTAEYAKMAERWDKQLEQYRQQLVNVQAKMRVIGMPEMQQLEPLPENYMVAETCGGDGAALPMKRLWTRVDITDDQGIRDQQRQICVNIRVMKNKQYNDSVEYLASSIPGMKKLLGDIYEVRSKNNDQGRVQGADSESLRTANDLEVSSMEWQGRMMAYDAYIQTMEENQRILANELLKGSRSNKLARSVVRTAALKAALGR